MTNLNDNDLLIERYFDGLLTTQEQTDFAQRRLKDTDFDREVLAYQKALDAIKIANRMRLKAQLTEHAHKNKVKRWKILRGGAYSLLAAASLVIGWFIFRDNAQKPLTYEAAFNETFKVAKSGGVEQSTNTELSLIDSAYLAYDNKDWQRSLDLLEKIKEPKSKTLFLKANAYMVLNNTEKAALILNDLKDNPPNESGFRPDSANVNERQEDIEWLLSLCALRQGNTSDLQKIAKNTNHFYALQAKDLLEKVKH